MSQPIQVSVAHADTIKESDVIWVDPVGFKKIVMTSRGHKADDTDVIALFWATMEGTIIPVDQMVLRVIA